MVRIPALNPIEEEAIAWMVELRSGATAAADLARFAQWLAADTRHQQAWQSLAGALDATFGSASAEHAQPGGQRTAAVEGSIQQALHLQAGRRRILRTVLGVTGLGAGSLWLSQSSGVLADWRADLHTATGERKTFVLADGSRLQLDARSSVDIRFRDDLRMVHLREGQLLADVRHDASSPFVVRTEHGSIRALNSQFAVRLEDKRTQAAAVKSDIWVGAANQSSSGHLMVAEGSIAWIDAQNVQPIAEPGLAASATAWTQGLIHVHDQPLGELIAALKPYRLGYLRISPAAARVRVTGIFSLDDSDGTLQALSDTLPVHVYRHSAGWLVRIELAA